MKIADAALKKRFLQTCEGLEEGRLNIATPEGNRHSFGAGGPEAEVVIHDWSAVAALAAHGQVGLGEAYVAGLWDSPSVEELIVVVSKNRSSFAAYDQARPLDRLKFRLVDTILRANTRRGSRNNIRAHYDVGNEFYQLWLDEGMTYSSALFDDPATPQPDLLRGQSRKNARVLENLSGGERLLEIGCGWGGFAEAAAEEGRDVTGLTISRNQHAFAESRLDGRADIRLCDYRDHAGTYDNIVSIEMIEAVGERYWPTYFATLKRHLSDGGRVLLQAITVRDDYFETYRRSSDFIRQYVFPGGMLLSDSQIEKQARASGLRVEESFDFGDSYAQTCRIWSQRLSDHKEKVLRLGLGEAFFRNWSYYLEICAGAFAVGQTSVVQVRLAHA